MLPTVSPAAPATLEAALTDPAARHDVPAWCRMRDQRLVSQDEVGGELRFVVELV